MSEEARQITTARMWVSIDPGHSGLSADYAIESEQAGYKVTLQLARLIHEPTRATVAGGYAVRSTGMTELLRKDQAQVQAFLDRLTSEFQVDTLIDQAWSYPFLHPTFYTFTFGNANGTSHSFTYRIEAAQHLDERYQRLVAAFDSFFESKRVFAAFSTR